MITGIYNQTEGYRNDTGGEPCVTLLDYTCMSGKEVYVGLGFLRNGTEHLEHTEQLCKS